VALKMPPKRRNIFNSLNRIVTGHEHCGPFNAVSDKAPSNLVDRACWEHDIQYGELGTAAYFKFNQSDQQLLDTLAGQSDRGASIAKGYFGFKKAAFPVMPGYSKKRKYNTPVNLFGGGSGHANRATPFITPRGKFNLYEGNVIRYKASVLSNKRLRRGRFKKQRYTPLRDMVTQYKQQNPIVSWKMIGGIDPPTLMVSPVGTQAHHSLDFQTAGFRKSPYGMFFRSDLIDIYEKLYIDVLRRGPVSAGAAGAGLGGSVGGPNDKKPTLYIHNHMRTLSIMNQMNSVGYIEVWEMVRKDDTSRNPSADFNESLTVASGSAFGFYGLRQMHLNSQQPTVEREELSTDPGRRPVGKWWNQRWGVLKKTVIKLEPHAMTKHKVFCPGFSISHQRLFTNGDATISEIIPNLTKYLMVFQIGERCYDNAEDAQAASYLPSHVSLTFEDHYVCSMRMSGPSVVRITTNIPDNFALTSVVDRYAIADAPAIATTDGNRPISDQPAVNQEANAMTP